MKKIDTKTIRSVISNIIYPLFAMGLVLAIWAIAAALKKNPLVLPMPDVVLERFFTLGADASFWINVGYTLLRTLICFAISFVLALGFAALGGMCAPVHKLISPIVSFLRAAPTVAVILILYAFFDSSVLAVSVGFLIAFPVLYTAFHSAIVGVDTDLIEMAKTYRVNNFNIVKYVYLPSIAGCMFDNGKSTLSLTLKVVVAAEILTYVPRSIGNSIVTANASFEIQYLLAWTLVAIVFSFVLEGIVSILKKLWEVSR